MNVSKNIALAAIVAVVGASGLTWAVDYNADSSANPGSPGSAAGTSANPDAISNSDQGALDESSAMNTLTGVVQKIDKANKSLQLQDSNGVSQTLKVSKSTEITRDGVAIQLAEIKKGDTITVRNSSPAM